MPTARRVGDIGRVINDSRWRQEHAVSLDIDIRFQLASACDAHDTPWLMNDSY